MSKNNGQSNGGGYILLSEGFYRGTVIDSGWEYSSKGTPGYFFTVVLDEKENEDTGTVERLDTPVRRKFTRWLSEGAVKRSLSEMRRLGYPHDDFTGLIPGPDQFEFADRPIRVSVRHGEYNDLRKEEIQIVRRLLTPEEQSEILAVSMAALKAADEKERKEKEVKALREIERKKLAASDSVTFSDEPDAYEEQEEEAAA